MRQETSIPLASVVQPDRKITYGIVQPGGFVDEGIPLVRGGDYSDGWSSLEDIKRVRPEIDAPYKRSKLKSGDILLTIVGANTGNVAVVPEYLEGANITQTTARIAVNGKLASRDFIFYVLQSPLGQREVYRFIKGGAQPGLNLEDIEKFSIPSLPLAEQERIVEILSDADAAIATAERQAAELDKKLRGLRKSLCQDKGAPKRLGDICRPKQWETISKEELTETGYPVFGANAYMGFYNSFNHEEDTIAVSCRGSCGEVSMIPGPSYITGNSMCLDEIDQQQILQDYLFNCLKVANITKIISGSAQPQIIRSDLERFIINVPEMRYQEKVTDAINSALREINAQHALVTALKKQKRGLMQQLLTGKLRVPEKG